MTAGNSNIRLDEVEDDDAGERDAAPADHLATTRLPPLARPLLPPLPVPPPRAPSASLPSFPPPAPTGAVSPTIPPPPLDIGGPIPTIAPPAISSTGEASDPSSEPPAHRSVDPGGAVRSSWWRALLTSTVPPSSGAGVASAGVRVRIALVAAALGVASLVAALVVGFGGPPQELLMSSTVAASIVISHAVMALGLFIVGLGFLRAAERMYFESPAPEARGHEAVGAGAPLH